MPLGLIVEDEFDLAAIFARALQAAGYITEVVQSGNAALDWLATQVPDLVVLDLNLPRVPGMEILRRIRADGRLAGVKVIVATAYPHLADAVRDNADYVLPKPVSFSTLHDLATRLHNTEKR